MKHEPPQVRQSLTMENHVDGLKFWVTLAFYDDQPLQPCDCFWGIAKEGSTLGGLCRQIALAVAIGFQHGVPWDDVKKHLSKTSQDSLGLTKVFSETIDVILAERARQLNYTQQEPKDVGSN